jgi:uncharacterized damage-inducible protein DinB
MRTLYAVIASGATVPTDIHLEEPMQTPRTTQLITPEELGELWQGHRRLTRRVIEAFPEAELFGYSIGGMRPFAQLARELLGLAGAGIHGVARGEWAMTPELDYHTDEDGGPKTKAALLELWDGVTRDIDTHWAGIPASRFQELDTAFGEYAGPVWSHVFYWIDNEVHHRGQGYVYLRSLGIEPPYFWER